MSSKINFRYEDPKDLSLDGLDPKFFGGGKIAEIHTIKVDNYSYFSYELSLDVVLSRKEYTFSV